MTFQACWPKEDGEREHLEARQRACVKKMENRTFENVVNEINQTRNHEERSVEFQYAKFDSWIQ